MTVSTEKKKFPCGCEFDVIDGRVQFDTDVEALNLECPRVWELLGEGRTTGIFQLESRLGSSFAKKLKPENLEHLSGLIAAIRPGCLDGFVDGKSITNHFVDRKNNNEEVSYYHPSLEDVLQDTYGLLIYQEQAMALVTKLANFDLSQADILRRAIGKKKPEEMAKVKEQFLEGCKTVGLVNDEEAQYIFSWIESSQRYSFNKCLSPDTIVETPNGYQTLEETKIGDFVNTPNGYQKVINKYDNGIKELYEITLEDGKTIKCTMDHEFLCEDNQKHPLWEILKKDLKIVVKLDWGKGPTQTIIQVLTAYENPTKSKEIG